MKLDRNPVQNIKFLLQRVAHRAIVIELRSTLTKPYNTPHPGLGSVSIPESKSAAQRWFCAWLDASPVEYPIELTEIARGYAETIFAMPVIPMAIDF
jgi:hypothetical protein